MKVTFEYEETQYLSIKSIAVIGDFNTFDASKGEMKKEGDKWVLECIAEPGQHFYKYLINDGIKLNDPLANLYLPDDHGELWSVLMISEEDVRLYNNAEYTVHIEQYNISSNIHEGQVPNNKKDFNLFIDKKVVTRFEFTSVTGLHSVTAIWFNALGEVFETSENHLYTPEGDEDKPLVIWFWINLEDSKRTYHHGLWTMKLFIDGQFVLEDKFNIGRISTYSSAGLLQSRA